MFWSNQKSMTSKDHLSKITNSLTAEPTTQHVQVSSHAELQPRTLKSRGESFHSGPVAAVRQPHRHHRSSRCSKADLLLCAMVQRGISERTQRVSSSDPSRGGVGSCGLKRTQLLIINAARTLDLMQEKNLRAKNSPWCLFRSLLLQPSQGK